MDRATFNAYRHLISQGESTPITELPYLTDEERSVFQLLNQNGWRVGDEWVEDTLARLWRMNPICVDLWVDIL